VLYEINLELLPKDPSNETDKVM